MTNLTNAELDARRLIVLSRLSDLAAAERALTDLRHSLAQELQILNRELTPEGQP